MYDLKVINAKTRNNANLVNIGIKGDKIADIGDSLPDDAKEIVDAKDNLLTESFVNGHLHLCKVYTLEKAGQKALQEYQQRGMGNALDSIQSASEFKTCYEESWIAENARKACELAVKHGVTHIRAFADVDSKGKLEGIKALIKVREEYKHKVELQVVAFPQDGVLREPGTRDLIEEALNMGGRCCRRYSLD